MRTRATDPDVASRLARECEALASQLGARPARVRSLPWLDDAPGAKRRRIRRVEALA